MTMTTAPASTPVTISALAFHAFAESLSFLVVTPLTTALEASLSAAMAFVATQPRLSVLLPLTHGAEVLLVDEDGPTTQRSCGGAYAVDFDDTAGARIIDVPAESFALWPSGEMDGSGCRRFATGGRTFTARVFLMVCTEGAGAIVEVCTYDAPIQQASSSFGPLPPEVVVG